MTTKLANPNTKLKVTPFYMSQASFDVLFKNPEEFDVLPCGDNEVQVHSRKHRRMVARKLDGKITGFIYE